MDSQASAIVDGKETSQQDLDDNNEVSTGEAFSNLEAVEAPKDNYYFVFWVTFLQGMGVLFPWNSFLAEPVYFTTIYGDAILFLFSLTYSYPNIIGQAIMTVWGNKLSLKMKVLVGYGICIICMLAIPIMAFAGIENYKSLGMGLTFTFLGLIAIATSMLQGSLFGFAGMFPPKYMTAMMSGNGAAGFIVALLRVITKIIFENDSRMSKFEQLKLSTGVYFSLSVLILIMCFITFVIVLKNPFTNHHMLKKEESLPLLKETNSSINKKEWKNDFINVLKISKKIWIEIVLILLCFGITLSAFPGLTLSPKGASRTSYPGTWLESWLPVLMNLCFNLFDFIGRSLPGFKIFQTKITTIKWILDYWLIIPNILRIVFLPLFMFCIKPRIFNHDVIPLLIMSIFALTNGYFSTLLMMKAPQKVEAHERDTAGKIMSLCLVTGIALGSAIGIGLGYLVDIPAF